MCRPPELLVDRVFFTFRHEDYVYSRVAQKWKPKMSPKNVSQNGSLKCLKKWFLAASFD
jgi:hypothetical protein